MVDFQKKTKKFNMDATKILASVLIVFPAIQSVNYESKDKILQFSFALKGKIEQDYFNNYLKIATDSLKSLHYLEGVDDATIEFKLEGIYETYFLNIRRDIATLTFYELSLLTDLAYDYFAEKLIVDFNEKFSPDEDYLIAQEEYLEQSLNNIRTLRVEGQLIGIRKRERVIVYAR